ncbi:MAG TPA: hypothetical protein ENG74_01890 [Thermoplasmatales archaeon]|nr:hypothetical protein [Thermoplasmatales archaeon]
MVPKRRVIPRKRVKLRKPKRIRFATRNNRHYREIVSCIPTKTLALTIYAFRWFLFLILVYIVISVTVMLFTQSYNFLQQIVTLSIGGFFGFFMGYFGWLFAHQITTWLSGKKKEKDMFKDLQF